MSRKITNRKSLGMNFALEKRISEAARTAIEELYGGEVKAEMVQLQETRAEFEGQLTLVVFPFLKMRLIMAVT